MTDKGQTPGWGDLDDEWAAAALVLAHADDVVIRYRTEGTAVWTLIRNLGSAVGVSIVIAQLTSTTTLMHARLAESLTPWNLGLQFPTAALVDPATTTGRALLEQLVTAQAVIIAYALSLIHISEPTRPY